MRPCLIESFLFKSDLYLKVVCPTEYPFFPFPLMSQRAHRGITGPCWRKAPGDELHPPAALLSVWQQSFSWQTDSLGQTPPPQGAIWTCQLLAPGEHMRWGFLAVAPPMQRGKAPCTLDSWRVAPPSGLGWICSQLTHNLTVRRGYPSFLLPVISQSTNNFVHRAKFNRWILMECCRGKNLSNLQLDTGWEAYTHVLIHVHLSRFIHVKHHHVPFLHSDFVVLMLWIDQFEATAPRWGHFSTGRSKTPR